MQPSQRPAFDTIVFASTQRTGSTALATTLSASNASRQTYEWFDPTSFNAMIRSRLDGFDALPATAPELERYVSAIRDCDAESGLPVSLMLHMYQFDELRGLGLDRLEDLFGRCVYVYNYRADIYYQAVSLHIAQQTQQWVSFHDRQGEPHYDFDNIHGLVSWIVRDCEKWLAYFRENNIVPFYAPYERFAEDPHLATQRLLDWLGLPGCTIGTTSLERQATALNTDYVRRYIADIGKRRVTGEDPAPIS